MSSNRERYPPRLAARIVTLGFDWESRKADYRSFVEEYQSRSQHQRLRSAQFWAYRSALITIWEALPSSFRGFVVAELIKLIVRNL